MTFFGLCASLKLSLPIQALLVLEVDQYLPGADTE